MQNSNYLCEESANVREWTHEVYLLVCMHAVQLAWERYTRVQQM